MRSTPGFCLIGLCFVHERPVGAKFVGQVKTLNPFCLSGFASQEALIKDPTVWLN